MTSEAEPSLQVLLFFSSKGASCQLEVKIMIVTTDLDEIEN